MNRRRHKKNPESSLEKIARHVLTAMKITFKQEYVVGYYVVDFFLPQQGGVIEIDGAHWHTSEAARSYDMKRDAWLKKRGFYVIRIPEATLLVDPVLAIKRAIDELNKVRIPIKN